MFSVLWLFLVYLSQIKVDFLSDTLLDSGKLFFHYREPSEREGKIVFLIK